MFSNLAQKFTAVKASILPTEADGDTEDDTHICRVLRSYYTEKGRAFPAWLPPDPRAPPPVVIQQAPSPYAQGAGRGYGGMGGAGGGGGSGQNLSSLFDAQPPQQQQGGGFDGPGQGPTSLRAGRAGGAAQRHNPFANSSARQQQQQHEASQVQARPLPSQRAGSQQSVSSAFGNRPDSGGPGMMSAKDKLKMGFGQKRSGSPAQNEQSSSQSQSYGRSDNYQPSSSGQRGYGGQPQQQSYSSAPYPTDNYGSGGGGGGYDRGNDRPFVASNAPWATNEMEFSGGGYDAGGSGGGGGGYDSRRQGLPSGPGAGKRGPGLPSGPRAPRF